MASLPVLFINANKKSLTIESHQLFNTSNQVSLDFSDEQMNELDSSNHMTSNDQAVLSTVNQQRKPFQVKGVKLAPFIKVECSRT